MGRLELPIIKLCVVHRRTQNYNYLGGGFRFRFRTSYTGNDFRACATSVNADFKMEVTTGASP